MKKKGLQRKMIKAASVLCINIWLFSTITLAQGPSTDVWIDVVKGPSLARVSVTVPLVYAFVVHGTIDTNDMDPITVDNGNILLPNIVVDVTDPSSNNSQYTIDTVGQSYEGSRIRIENYSTDVLEAHLEEENPPRVGLAVNLDAAIIKPVKMVGGSEVELTDEEKAFWQAVDTQPTPISTDFKKYRLSIDGKRFNVIRGDELHMEASILLDAPPYLETYGYDAGGKAYVPTVIYPETMVEIGGTRGQYDRVERSAKVGMIIWTVEPVPQPSTP